MIEPQEFLNPNVDEMSMMTYLSQYPNSKLKPGAPLREKTDFSKVQVYGAGIESGKISVDRPIEFFLKADDYKAGEKSRLFVRVVHKATRTELPVMS